MDLKLGTMDCNGFGFEVTVRIWPHLFESLRCCFIIWDELSIGMSQQIKIFIDIEDFTLTLAVVQP